jgi:hypothetical protein
MVCFRYILVNTLHKGGGGGGDDGDNNNNNNNNNHNVILTRSVLPPRLTFKNCIPPIKYICVYRMILTINSD